MAKGKKGKKGKKNLSATVLPMQPTLPPPSQPHPLSWPQLKSYAEIFAILASVVLPSLGLQVSFLVACFGLVLIALLIMDVVWRSPWTHKWGFINKALVFALLVIAIAALLKDPVANSYKTYFHPEAPTAALKDFIEKGLDIADHYPNEWPLTDWGKKIEKTSMPSVKGRILKAPYTKDREYRLTPVIWNRNNGGIIVENPVIIAGFPLNIEVKAEHWVREQSDNYQYFYGQPVSNVSDNLPSGVANSLFFKMPGASSFQVLYRVTGVAQGLSVMTEADFMVEVVESPK